MSDIATEGRAFTLRHPADRIFFLVMLLVIWAAMLGGFTGVLVGLVVSRFRIAGVQPVVPDLE